MTTSSPKGLYVGWAGVDLFFVLSGFLITGILIDARGSERYFSSFYARRTLRIFPLYYLIAFLSLIVLPAFPFAYDLLVGLGAPREQWPYWLYLTNFAVAERERFIHGILDVTWSLAIEEQFYLAWAVVVWLCPTRLLGPLCAAIIVAVAGARIWALAAGATAIDVYVLTLYRADGLATGALLAWAMRRGWLAGAGGSALALSALTVLGVVGVSWLDGESWWWGPTMQKAGYTLLALTGGAWIVAAVRLPDAHWWPRALSAGWLRVVRQVQLLPVPDSSAGDAHRARVRARPRAVRAVRIALDRSAGVLRAHDRRGIRGCLDLVASVRGADCCG